jgi:hypothetical protein
MDKNIIYAYSGTLFSSYKEGNLAMWDNMDEPEGYYVNWNKMGTVVQACNPSYLGGRDWGQSGQKACQIPS